MSQLISNVLMQPKSDAVERLTLIEKLKQLSDKYLNQYKYYGDNADLNCSSAVDEAINIVKQHGDWISVDERLPPHNNNEANTPKILGDSKTYGVISVTYDAPRNLWFTYGGDDQIFDITSWMFAPEPPSEVQA